MRGSRTGPLAHDRRARVRLTRSTGVPAGIGLTFDDPFGELNQHALRPKIPQFAKGPQQAQFE